MAESKAPAKPRITAEQRKDWRNLPLADWNTLTVMTQIIDLNRERYGANPYIPTAGGYRYEQGVIKRALTLYGEGPLRETIERAFCRTSCNSAVSAINGGIFDNVHVAAYHGAGVGGREAEGTS